MSNITGDRVRALREERGLTQEELAEQISASRITVNRVEAGNGKQYPTTEIIVALANYFNVTTDYLLGRTDTPTLYRHDMAVAGADKAYLLTPQKESPAPEEREQLETMVNKDIRSGKAIQLDIASLPRNRQELEQVIREQIQAWAEKQGEQSIQ